MVVTVLAATGSPARGQSSTASRDPSFVIAEIVRGRRDRASRRCRVRIRVLERDADRGPAVGEELDTDVDCYAFTLHQLRRRGRTFRMRIVVQPRPSGFRIEIIGGPMMRGERGEHARTIPGAHVDGRRKAARRGLSSSAHCPPVRSATAHRVPAVEALVTSAIADRDVATLIAHRRVAHHLAHVLIERVVSVGRGARRGRRRHARGT